MKVKMTELDLDLQQIRDVKRLFNRGMKKLAAIEKALKKKKVLLREDWRDQHARRRERKAPTPPEPTVTP